MPIQLTAQNDEFLASGASTTWETQPAMDRLAGGGFVIAWADETNPSVSVDIKVQLFDSDGAKVGPELLVDAETDFPYQAPAIAGLPSGHFIVAWASRGVAGDMNGSAIKARIYDAAGNPVGAEFLVNSTTSFDQLDPAVTVLASGAFAITWSDQSASGGDTDHWAVRAQLFDSSGARSGGEILVNTLTFGDQTSSGLTALASGGFVASWSSGLQVKAQIFNSTGAKVGGEFFINTGTMGSQYLADLAALPNGGFVATWSGGDGSGPGIKAQIFDAAGLKVGSEISVNTVVQDLQSAPKVEVLAQGGFMIVWSDFSDQPDSGQSSIKAQLFDASGNKLGGEVVINSIANASESQPAVTQLSTNEIVVSWSDGIDVKSRIFFPEVSGTEDVDVYFGTGTRDVYRGLGGSDLIDGGGGDDTMAGGTGDDIYFVGSVGDVVIENEGEGTDQVRTGLASYVLSANVEVLLAVSGGTHDFRGNSVDNVIAGGPGNDVFRLYDGGDDRVLAEAGNDTLFFIGSLTAADRVEGGDGVDTLVIQGPYGALALTANVVQIENISILGGNNTNFGEPGTNLYDYVLTTSDANFAAGVQARINGAALLEGEDFTFDGSAETDAKFVVYGGKGVDTLTGGLGNDIFFYAEERFASGDTVNGGAGYDGMFLRGNYIIDFNAPGYTGLFTSIENLTLTSVTDERYARGGGTEFDYNIILSDTLVGAGQTLTISGSLLTANETMTVVGNQESDGFLRLFGGAANDNLVGGANADLIQGGLGADEIQGGGGADLFRYQSTAESSGAAGATDRILDFAPGTDKLELDRIDADSNVAGNQAFTWIGASAFTGVAGQLRAYESGPFWLVEGDTNGDGVADLVIGVDKLGPVPLGAGDFIL